MRTRAVGWGFGVLEQNNFGNVFIYTFSVVAAITCGNGKLATNTRSAGDYSAHSFLMVFPIISGCMEFVRNRHDICVCLHRQHRLCHTRAKSMPDVSLSHASYAVCPHTISWTKTKSQEKEMIFYSRISQRRRMSRKHPSHSDATTTTTTKYRKFHFTAELNNKRCTPCFAKNRTQFGESTHHRTNDNFCVFLCPRWRKSENENTFSYFMQCRISTSTFVPGMLSWACRSNASCM